MARRKVQFVNREIYHIIIKAIDGINLFRDKKDYLRMIHDLFEFNDINHALSNFRVIVRYHKINLTKKDLVKITEECQKKRKKRKILVEILAFCLMPNHIHLLVRQLQEKGISKFMKKLGGYALYYNKRYERKGHLFQDKFQAILIEKNEQLKTAFVYIHTNPVAIIYPGWKEKGIENAKRAIEYIENYRWSSYPDYLGKRNFPSLTNREFLLRVIGGKEGCRNFVNAWLKFKQNLANFDYVAIE
jgi:putative transposase